MEHLKVLVTGSSGFMGSHLVALLNREGYQVKGLDILTPEQQGNAPQGDYFLCDINDRERLVANVREFAPDAILHLAARRDLDGLRVEDYVTNVQGVENLFCAIEQTPSVRRCIVTSSQLVCKVGYVPSSDDEYSPVTIYGESKVLTEQLTRKMAHDNLIWCLVRPTTIWGPGMSAHYQRFFKTIEQGLYFHTGNSPLRKSYGYVKNTAHQYLKLLQAPSEKINHKTFYVADYEPLSLREWANTFQQQLGAPPIRTFQEPLAQFLAKGGDLAKALGIKAIPFDSFRLRNILTEYQFDMTLMEEICGPLPYNMEEGVRETVAWLNQL